MLDTVMGLPTRTLMLGHPSGGIASVSRETFPELTLAIQCQDDCCDQQLPVIVTDTIYF